MEKPMHPAEIVAMAFLAVFFVMVVVSLFFGVFYLQAEHLYSLAFNKPFYVHFYPFPKKLEPNKQAFLRQHSSFYNRLTVRQKRFFDHRVHRFLEKYEFVGREGFSVTDETKVLIAERYVMLTFGMRHYLVSVFDRIAVYPEAFYSQSADAYHLGEFNPRARTVSFSWADFVKGNEIQSDNLNLGIHEFAHVIHFHGSNRGDISASVFAKVYDRIVEEIHREPNRQRLLDSGYFREYAYSNRFEFLAVILEHYFETPSEFKMKFPELYANVSKMLNHKH